MILLEIEHNHLLSTMTTKKWKIYDTIMLSENLNNAILFFLYGYGGTHKFSLKSFFLPHLDLKEKLF